MFNPFKKKPIKVKLTAIASNEAAYLPEWIFHHLYFGFDEITILVNRTNDITWELVPLLANYPNVTFKNVDEDFYTGAKNPQICVYKKELSAAYNNGFSHVFFLDVDEFWTPQDLASKISYVAYLNRTADSTSFEWCNTVEDIPFARLITRDNEVKFSRAPQVKSLIRLRSKPYRMMNPHNVRDPELK